MPRFPRQLLWLFIHWEETFPGWRAPAGSGVIVGEKGVIVIDAKISPASGKELLEDVGKITAEPVNTVILTHSDRDHVNGLAAFPTRITIIAQENNKKEQERAIAAGGKDAPSADHLPTRLITRNKDHIKVDDVPLELLHWGPAHTSGSSPESSGIYSARTRAALNGRCLISGGRRWQ